MNCGCRSGDEPPRPGSIHVQPDLARALESIAMHGTDIFYEGWIAEDIVRTLRAIGGKHAMDNFAEWRPSYDTPISSGYRGFELWECSPNGQGVTPLQMAMMLERASDEMGSDVG
jgi:gamma-glutamyltranspeptidase / glutathione hydrolase